ncbi:hypothetical protein CE91St46_06890 [Eubacteriales bacterium]|nr:hypothetical protein CE91St46_06890 [Eubacteriales bacterium]GKH62219.1 hypothetical protein CE91St47_06880 [Eubacteriales bacterium]
MQDPFKPSAQPEVLFCPDRPRVIPPLTNGFDSIMEMSTVAPAPLPLSRTGMTA